MNPDIFQYIVIISISGVLSILLSIYAYVKRNTFTGNIKVFIWMSCFSAIYSIGHALELSSGSLKEISFWVKVQYIGMPFIAPSSLVLIMYYVGLERLLNLRMKLLIFTIPLITLLLVMTNDLHHFYYRSLYLRPNEDTPLVDIIAGPWYIVNSNYTFGCIILSIALLFWHWKRTKSIYWKQIVVLILGEFLPMVFSFLYLMGLSPYGMDPVPIVMCFTSLLYIWAIKSTYLLVLTPIARERVFENMRDGVLVINNINLLVDYNNAAKEIIKELDNSSIGARLENMLICPSCQNILMKKVNSDKEEEFDYLNEMDNKYYQIRIDPIRRGNQEIVGKTIVIRDITEKKCLENKLKRMAYIDGMTKIYNRSFFLEKSQKQMELAKKLNQPISFCLFDIDYFKKVNDEYGHSIGDLAICHVVSICKKHLLPENIMGRYGGEEFIICFPGIDLIEAGRKIEEIRKEFAINPLETEKGSIYVTASFGIVQLNDRFNTLELLLQESDRALYSAKECGRNSVHLSFGDEIVPFPATVSIN
ncbi:histidine kinase N-terminal 7TM domain-containing diguanylate cyclase [Bacillus massilinigeriensis]|uniref:histidine kinase N-terminal 7TM domain-containing diguanylate cyclase n=1 Tax=Bacillus massilionigeriensis TaxID=1805475 RepID=UPI00096B40E3|nr:histidine kinase N-terminal 7TM domain-containing protein [Bacillus massilionigeriensis]